MDLARNDVLLVNALQLCVNDDNMNPMKELSESDWEGLADNAIQHGVSPFLWHHFRPVAKSLGIPRNVIDKFTKSYIQSTGKGVVVQNQLSGLLQTFVDNNIPVIVLKGAYLADKIYGDFSIRPMTDIDLLIKPENARSVENGLLKSKYIAIRSTSEPICNHYIYQPLCNGVRIEIHTELQNTNRRYLDMDMLWKRSEATTIVGCNARILALEDLILYQCYHHSKHLFNHFGLRSLCDLALIIKRHEGEINWNLLAVRSQEYHLTNCVMISMELLNKYLRITVPESFMANRNSPESRSFTMESFYPDIFNSKKKNNMNESAIDAPKAVNLMNSIKTFTFLTLLQRALFSLRKSIVNRHRTGQPSESIAYIYIKNISRYIFQYSRLIWKIIVKDTNLTKRIKVEATHQRTQALKGKWLKFDDFSL